MVRLLVITLLGLLPALRQGEDHVTFVAEGLGPTGVTTSFPNGGFPTANFRNGAGRLLYSVPVGNSEPDIFRIDKTPSKSSPELPALSPPTMIYFVQSSKAQPTSVLAIAMYTGGSDCEYVPALVGPMGGQLKSWLQQEPVVNGQGGFYIGDLGGHRGFGLAAWNFIWEDGPHRGEHRYNVKLYHIDTTSGKSFLVFKADSKRKYVKGTDALKEFGFHYQNVLSSSPSLGC